MSPFQPAGKDVARARHVPAHRAVARGSRARPDGKDRRKKSARDWPLLSGIDLEKPDNGSNPMAAQQLPLGANPNMQQVVAGVPGGAMMPPMGGAAAGVSPIHAVLWLAHDSARARRGGPCAVGMAHSVQVALQRRGVVDRRGGPEAAACSGARFAGLRCAQAAPSSAVCTPGPTPTSTSRACPRRWRSRGCGTTTASSACCWGAVPSSMRNRRPSRRAKRAITNQ